MNKTVTIKLPKTVITKLALHWDRDSKTIRRWAKKNHPLLTHPESLKIINNTK